MRRQADLEALGRDPALIEPRTRLLAALFVDAARIAQGADTLHKHAIEGFQGKAGLMPPKGGRTDLSDQSVINAVEYIVAAAQ